MADETQPESTQPASPAPEPAQIVDPAALAPPAESTPQGPPPPAPSSAPGESPADSGSGTEPAAETAPAASGPAATPGPGPVTNPVTVNNYTQRDDNDALEGGWVDIVDGPYAGRYGAYVQNLSHNAQDGYPHTILVRTRDANNELIQVQYAQVRPSERTGGR